uniref:EB domain-containing protein n=1 Tax=Meloidogyne hapla TaxID=6305 RepID=A0A1I8BS42_MELHA
MNFLFLLPFLFINFNLIKSQKATIEQCDTVMNYNIGEECVCLADFPKCLKALINEGTCTRETYPPNFIEKPCATMYSKCALKKNGCEIGVCACFNSVVDCLVQDKCKELTLTKVTGSATSKSKFFIKK